MTGMTGKERRSGLMATACAYAKALRKRKGAAGLALYGSLAGDPSELTRFSDIDIAVILDGPMPEHFTEHRLVGGIKADLLLFRLDNLREIGKRSPEQLRDSTWTEGLFIKGLMKGGTDTVLFDPTGEIKRVKKKLTTRIAWPDLARMNAGVVMKDAESALEEAVNLAKKGEYRQSQANAGYALDLLLTAMQELGNTKKPAVAAERMGVPALARRYASLRKRLAPDGRAVDVCWRANRAIWDFLLREFYAPIEARLREEGVPDPDSIELAGDHPLFWPGNRIHEYGRLKAETELTFRWSRQELEEGRTGEAFDMMSWFGAARELRKRCAGLSAALRAIGHDVTPAVRRVLRLESFRKLMAEAENAERACHRADLSRAGTEKTIAPVKRLVMIVDGAMAFKDAMISVKDFTASAR